MKATTKENRDKNIPLFSKYYIYKILNLFLISFFSLFSPKWLLRSALQKTQIKYLNLGGYRATEDYLNIQLSPVELYGIPTIQHTTVSLYYDEVQGIIEQQVCKLTFPVISLHYNILKGLPLDSDSLLGINMSHILEHFTREEGLKVLKDCHRVLVPGGVLRISCPDLLVYAKAYINRDSSFYNSTAIRMACCYEDLNTYGDKFISKAYDNENGHKWFYDAESAIDLLKTAGFRKIEERQLHDSSLPNIENIEPEHRQAESFYIEAIK
ncbi:class I SAM-dependent methyltransferase [Nostoc sp.]|uniref:class I SAM-dependent methyltransferase n=1 Tax=Nostoc sp. TaxID=1180 RepID=UPI002FFA1E05